MSLLKHQHACRTAGHCPASILARRFAFSTAHHTEVSQSVANAVPAHELKPLEQFRNWCRPKQQAFSWFSPRENHPSRSLSDHSNCETALELSNLVEAELHGGQIYVLNGSYIRTPQKGER